MSKEYDFSARDHLKRKKPRFDHWVRSGRSPGERNGNPLQYSCLENSMDRGAGWGPWGHKKLDMI